MSNLFSPINQRFVDAENSFLEVLQTQGGISRNGAEKVLAAWKKHKLVKVDSFDGRISVKHGGLLDRENILESFRHVIEESGTCRYCKKGTAKENPAYSRKSVFWLVGNGREIRGTAPYLVKKIGSGSLEGFTITDNKGNPVAWETVVDLAGRV